MHISGFILNRFYCGHYRHSVLEEQESNVKILTFHSKSATLGTSVSLIDEYKYIGR